MTDWIEWHGGDCPIKSDKTMVEYKMKGASLDIFQGKSLRWNWEHNGNHGDIIAYRITEDHEPTDYDASPIYTHTKMTREQIKSQIEALQKQLDAMPRYFWKNGVVQSFDSYGVTHCFDIELVNGVPVSVTIKEVGK